MTIHEADIARVAFRLGYDAARILPPLTSQILDRFILHYAQDRPCRYAVECVKNSRCPFDPVCNN